MFGEGGDKKWNLTISFVPEREKSEKYASTSVQARAKEATPLSNHKSTTSRQPRKLKFGMQSY